MWKIFFSRFFFNFSLSTYKLCQCYFFPDFKVQLKVEDSFFGLSFCLILSFFEMKGKRTQISFIYLFSKLIKLNFDFCLIWESVYLLIQLIKHFNTVRVECVNNCWFNQYFSVFMKLSTKFFRLEFSLNNSLCQSLFIAKNNQ